MPLRILLAESSRPVIAAIRRDLEERGCALASAAPADAASRAAPGRYGAALVRGTGPVAEVMADLRAADPLLPVVVLFLDRKEAAAAGPLDADGVLVGPLTASAVGTVCAFAGKLRDAATRTQALEARLAALRGGRDLEFLKKLLFVEVKRSRRYGHPLSLALVALDRWAELAPKLAARARTTVLAELLGVVRGSLRDIDFAVPFSDERIVVMMPHTGADGALRVARRLAARIRDHAGPLKVTASVGVASHAGDGTVSFGSLVRRAGEALERARGQGGDRAEPADPVKKRDRISIG
jgi:two-component system, cell cycle response regulator